MLTVEAIANEEGPRAGISAEGGMYFAEMAEMRLCAMTIFSSAVLAIESEGISGGRSIERKYGVASR